MAVDGARPSNVHYDYSVRNSAGNTVYEKKDVFSNQAGEIFKRISNADIAKLLGR